MTDRMLYTQFDSIFFEKTRLSMMTMLYREGMVSFNRFKKIIGGTDGAVYSHLKKLYEAGYINQKKEIAGNSVQTVYSITGKGKKLFKRYLEFLETTVLERGEK
jgi:DNA-binding transcriptional ArsR family regulator